MKTRERAVQLASDILTINLAWSLYYLFRVKTGWLTYGIEPDYVLPMAAICVFWLLLFFLFGLYRSWYTKSRFDEVLLLAKSVTFGVLILFFLIFFDDRGAGSPFQSRLLIAIYWALMMGCVGGGRMLHHTFQRRLLEAGIGLRNAVIVGLESKAHELYESVIQYPALGYRIVGFVTTASARATSASMRWRERSRCGRSSSWPTNPFPRWTYLCGLKSSICWTA